MRLPTRLSFVIALCVALLSTGFAGADEGEGRLLRFPDIHGDFVVFVYAGDLWRAPSDGGAARRLTAHAGLELFPQISPDGRWIAFSAEYTGSRQVYVMPSGGGPSRQLTFYNEVGPMPPRGGWDNWILGWSPDGKILVRMNRTPWGVRMGRYFLVDPEGGGASFSPDGKKLAYCPVSREFRTWKRTRGGRAQDIWIYDLEKHESTQVSRSRATENFPLWAGDTLYHTSDADGTLNLYAHDLDAGEDRQVTRFDDFDVLWPSLGPESIVYMRGGYLERLDLAGGDTRRIPIRIETDLPFTVPHFEDVSENVSWGTISPSGARVVFDARGDLFSVPVEHGATRNLTDTPGVREMNPEWSPDGRWLAYLSDESGDYELYVRDLTSNDPPRRLTDDGYVWRHPPVWSPDSEYLAFGDRDRRLMILRVEDGKQTEVDRGILGDLTTFVWSPDSRWLAYQKGRPNRLVGISAYSLDRKESVLLGDGLTNDYDPVFSADGSHLFFISDRDYNLTFSSFEFNYLYQRAGRIYVTALDPAASALFPPRSDEEVPAPDDGDDDGDDGDDDGDDGDDGDDDGDDDASGEESEEAENDPDDEALTIEPEGWVSRTISLPGLPSGDYNGLQAADGAVFYLRAQPSGGSHLYRYDLQAREEKKARAEGQEPEPLGAAHEGRSASGVAPDLRRRLADHPRLVLRPRHARQGLGQARRTLPRAGAVRGAPGGPRLHYRRADLRVGRRPHLRRLRRRARHRADPGRAPRLRVRGRPAQEALPHRQDLPRRELGRRVAFAPHGAGREREGGRVPPRHRRPAPDHRRQPLPSAREQVGNAGRAHGVRGGESGRRA
jgi:tricorn protease